MKITENNLTRFPQTEAIPLPLEIHPSVDPELARGLIAACDHINSHPEELDIHTGYNSGPGKKGCIICHVERLSGWRRLGLLEAGIHPDFTVNKAERVLPLGNAARLYRVDYWPNQFVRANYSETSVARVEHFLTTGE